MDGRLVDKVVDKVAKLCGPGLQGPARDPSRCGRTNDDLCTENNIARDGMMEYILQAPCFLASSARRLGGNLIQPPRPSKKVPTNGSTHAVAPVRYSVKRGTSQKTDDCSGLQVSTWSLRPFRRHPRYHLSVFTQVESR